MSEKVTFEQEVDKLLRAEPFVPFSLILTSGDRYEVENPGLSFFGENVVYLIQPKSGLAIFRKNQIVGVDVRPGAV